MKDVVSLDKAIELLATNYGKAVTLDYVNKPVSWALYQTWKEIDDREKNKERAKWVFLEENNYGSKYKCSNCGAELYKNGFICPRCNSRME